MLELMINEEVTEVDHAPASLMLLDYLRENQGLTGTKEGCASGDCGACTVVVVDLDAQQELQFKQINACITPINALHGKHVVTVEHLSKNGELHPVQQAIVDKHASQCGFCTPGIVMSLYALSKRNEQVFKPTDYLAGNLCRCTGYGPIIDAVDDIAKLNYSDTAISNLTQLKHWLDKPKPGPLTNYHKPKTRAQLAQAKQSYPNALLMAGGTDLALEVTQKLIDIPQIIDLSDVDDLNQITATKEGWRIGAAVPLNIVHAFMKQNYPSTDEVFERLGSLTIRNRATLGGSLGHASPIGDIAPLLISLNGSIELDNGSTKTILEPANYITGYRKTQLKNDQWISAVHIPTLNSEAVHAIYKVSKRFEDDIATVVLALNFRFDKQAKVTSCCIAAGGIAEKSLRLSQLEQHILGKHFTQALVQELKTIIAQIVTPISDVRGSAHYRVTLVQNLIQRFYFERNQIQTRLV